MTARIGRRSFLETAGRIGAGAILGSIPLINGCKGGGPTTPDEPPDPAVPVDLDFTVYNHTQGPRGSFRRTGVMSGTSVELSVPALISELGITDVYRQAICIRDSASGTRVASSRIAAAAEFPAPRIAMSYDDFLYNIGGQDLYATGGTGGMPLQFGPTPRAFRKDNGPAGDERVWGGEFIPEIGEFGVFDQINRTLKPEWAPWSYGHIERKPAPNDDRGDFAYGFGPCQGRDSGAFFAGVFFPVMWTGIDTTLVPDLRDQVARGLGIVMDALFNTAIGYLFTDRNIPAWQVVQEDGVLKEGFKDFLPYAFLLA